MGVWIGDDILNEYTAEVVDSDVEDVMWVKICGTQDEEERLLLAVCYFPPESSSGRIAEERLQLLAEQVEKFSPMGPVIMIICGDFNARCGEGVEEGWEVPPHRIVDSVN